MLRVCIHLVVHDHLVSIGTWHESLNMVYECITKVVMKKLIVKEFTIVMVTSKQFLANNLFKSPSDGNGHYLASSSLKVVLDRSSKYSCNPKLS